MMRAPIGISLPRRPGRIAVAVPALVHGDHQRRGRPQVRNDAEDVEADPHVLTAERGLQLALRAVGLDVADRESPACRCRAATRTARPAPPAVRAIRPFGRSPSRSAPPAARGQHASGAQALIIAIMASSAAREAAAFAQPACGSGTGGPAAAEVSRSGSIDGEIGSPPERLELIDVQGLTYLLGVTSHGNGRLSCARPVPAMKIRTGVPIVRVRALCAH